MLLNPSLDDVRSALEVDNFDVEAAHMMMAPSPRPMLRPPEYKGEAKLGGVLVLLYPSADNSDRLDIVLTKRADTVANHKGQVSFPGGARELDESLDRTALREAQEELAVDPESLTILGRLAKMYILPSDFEVYPLVAYAPVRPNFKTDPAEVAEVLEMPLSMLLDANSKAVEPWTIQGMQIDVPFYRLEGHTIWGATAVILSELEQRLRLILSEGEPD